MSKQANDWVKWASIATIIGVLFAVVTVLGRGVDVARAPERMDKIDEHLVFTDARVTALEQFRLTNTITEVFLLREMETEIRQIHHAVTN